MLRQGLHQKLLQKLSPQQIQLMKLLQLPTVALEQRIKEELEVNPALEEGEENNEEDQKDEIDEDDAGLFEDGSEAAEGSKDDDFALGDYMNEDEGYSYKEHANNKSADDERREMPLVQGPGFHDLLLTQLGLQPIDDHQYNVGAYLIGNIDEDGYMRRELAAVVDDIMFSQNISTTEFPRGTISSLIRIMTTTGSITPSPTASSSRRFPISTSPAGGIKKISTDRPRPTSASKKSTQRISIISSPARGIMEAGATVPAIR